MSDKNIRIVRGIEGISVGTEDQWTIHWIKFHYGIHPAIIISNGRYFDNGTAIVLPITSSKPNLDKMWSNLSIPIKLEGGLDVDDRWGFINVHSIETINKKFFRGFIGIVPEAYRELIWERYKAIVLGNDVSTLIEAQDVELMIEGDSTDFIAESEDENIDSDVSTIINVEIANSNDTTEIVILSESDNDVVEEDRVTFTYERIKQMIRSEYSSELMNHLASIFDAEGRMKIQDLNAHEMVVMLAVIIKKYGVNNMKHDPKQLGRFRYVLDRLVERKIIDQFTKGAIYSNAING